MNFAPDFFTLALWGVAALTVACVLLPMVLAILGFTRVQILPTGGPDDAVPTGDDPGYADLFDRLREMGFRPAGRRVEKGWFYLWYWCRTSLPGYLLVSPRGDCYASLYRLYRGDPWRLCFSTVLTDGTLVSTANQMERLRIDRPGYYRRGYVTQDLAELLRLHEDAVADFAARGGTVATPDLKEYCDVAAQRTEEYLREKGKGQSFKCFYTALLLLGFCAAASGAWLGFDHWAVPAAVIGGGVLYMLLMPTTIRSGAQAIQRQEEESALANRWARTRRMRAMERAAREAGPDENIYPSERRRPSPETIRAEPPPLPPTDFTRPPGL